MLGLALIACCRIVIGQPPSCMKRAHKRRNHNLQSVYIDGFCGPLENVEEILPIWFEYYE